MNPGVPQSYIDQLSLTIRHEQQPSISPASAPISKPSSCARPLKHAFPWACVSVRRRGVSYAAFCDPSGGSSDSMTLCIGHSDFARNTVVAEIAKREGLGERHVRLLAPLAFVAPSIVAAIAASCATLPARSTATPDGKPRLLGC